MRARITKLVIGSTLGALTLGALTLGGVAGPAAAAEQLVMPFACSNKHGQVWLVPSAPRAYPIYGHRESKQFTTCSPHDPRNCHTWSVHRFDLDCGGVRTSWRSVVAALSPLLAESIGAPGGGYADHAPPWAYAPEGRYGPDQRGRPGSVIDFPQGFAPNPMRVASFRGTPTPPPPMTLPPKKPAPAVTAQIEPDLEPAAATAPPDAEVGHAIEISPTSTPPEEATAVAKSESEPRLKPEPEPQPKTETETEPQPQSEPTPQPLEIELASGSEETTGSLPRSGMAADTLWRDAAIVFISTLAALLALTAALLLWRRRTETLSIPFVELSPWPIARLPAASCSVPEKAEAREEDPDGSATRLRLWDEDWLPTTMSEAFDVLGVDPDASSDIMKNTVRRLRRALHPDHALDEEDRRLRERRLKQINVAWDIVSGKRRSLWLPGKPQSA